MPPIWWSQLRGDSIPQFVNERYSSRRLEPLGLNRTLLLLLVIGLFIVAWQRNKNAQAPAPASAPPVENARPAAAAPTNSVADHNLASVEQTIHK